MCQDTNSEEPRCSGDRQSVLEESRATLDYQSDIIFEISNDAIEVIKINLLIGTLVFGALQIQASSRPDSVLHPLVIAGGVALLFSVLVSQLTYIEAEATIGHSKQGLESLVGKDDPRSTLTQWHGNWIEENDSTMEYMSWLITISLGLSTLGLILIIGGGVDVLT